MTPSGQRRGASRKARSLVIEPECLEDLRWWVDTNRKTALRVLDLIEAVMRDPFSGIGKPEHLKQMGPHILFRRIVLVRAVHHFLIRAHRSSALVDVL